MPLTSRLEISQSSPTYISLISSTVSTSEHIPKHSTSMNFTTFFFSICLIISLVSAAPLDQTCPCRKQNSLKVSTCARQAGDPNWCNFHICATGYECVAEQESTHTCVKKEHKGIHVCDLKNGEIVKPRPQDDTRCRCRYLKDRIVTHVSPRS